MAGVNATWDKDLCGKYLHPFHDTLVLYYTNCSDIFWQVEFKPCNKPFIFATYVYIVYYLLTAPAHITHFYFSISLSSQDIFFLDKLMSSSLFFIVTFPFLRDQLWISPLGSIKIIDSTFTFCVQCQVWQHDERGEGTSVHMAVSLSQGGGRHFIRNQPGNCRQRSSVSNEYKREKVKRWPSLLMCPVWLELLLQPVWSYFHWIMGGAWPTVQHQSVHLFDRTPSARTALTEKYKSLNSNKRRS